MNSQIGSAQPSFGVGRSGLKYFLVGSGIGAVAALLFTPKAGSEIRGSIADATKRGYEGTLDMAKKFKDQSTGLYHSLLEGSPSDKEGGLALVGGGSEAENSLADIRNTGGSMNDDVLSITDQNRNTSAGRKSTNIV